MTEKELIHYGVLGMKWGKRKRRTSTSNKISNASSKSSSNSEQSLKKFKSKDDWVYDENEIDRIYKMDDRLKKPLSSNNRDALEYTGLNMSKILSNTMTKNGKQTISESSAEEIFKKHVNSDFDKKLSSLKTSQEKGIHIMNTEKALYKELNNKISPKLRNQIDLDRDNPYNEDDYMWIYDDM